MLIYGLNIWQELYGLAEKYILVKVEHVLAHRRQKENEDLSQFERFVTEGNKKADELANAGAMLEGFIVETGAKTVQQERDFLRCTHAALTAE